LDTYCIFIDTYIVVPSPLASPFTLQHQDR
jgi:hypothetical protein